MSQSPIICPDGHFLHLHLPLSQTHIQTRSLSFISRFIFPHSLSLTHYCFLSIYPSPFSRSLSLYLGTLHLTITLCCSALYMSPSPLPLLRLLTLSASTHADIPYLQPCLVHIVFEQYHTFHQYCGRHCLIHCCSPRLVNRIIPTGWFYMKCVLVLNKSDDERRVVATFPKG